MHILVINDDGPPSAEHSPFVLPFVRTLQQGGHLVSVVVPHVQRSWIGKAHFVGEVVVPSYYRLAGSQDEDADGDGEGTVCAEPLPIGSGDEKAEEWILCSGTPATCAQLGLFHFFKSRPKVDLVVSGPNYGRNTTALFSLSSGTIGGAMEAAVCGYRAIAVSYAYKGLKHEKDVIEETGRHSLKIIEHLYENWADDVDVYNINVPLARGVEKKKIFFTEALHNRWRGASSFREMDPVSGKEVETKAKEAQSTEDGKPLRHTHMKFKWAPRFQDVQKSIEESEPGNDGWTILQGDTSQCDGAQGKLYALESSSTWRNYAVSGKTRYISPSSLIAWPLSAKLAMAEYESHDGISSSPTAVPKFQAFISYGDDYIQPLLARIFSESLSSSTYQLLPSLPSLKSYSRPYLQITSYETLSHEHLLHDSASYFGNAYTIRKALIRKHHLAATAASYISKHPDCALSKAVPRTVAFELDYAEFLDEALMESDGGWELQESWKQNEEKEEEQKEWWILKPAMGDRGIGISLFESEDELVRIFEALELDEDDDEAEETEGTPKSGEDDGKSGVYASQLRHFVAQPYIAPLLLPQLNRHKFHLRVYVLAVGALKVFLHSEILVLCAPSPFVAPWEQRKQQQQEESEGEEAESKPLDMNPHLTNTCLQEAHGSDSDKKTDEDFLSVRVLSSLPSALAAKIISRLREVTADLFRAAVAQPTSFQPLPNAFEVFGLDFLVDDQEDIWLLEVNAFPDFKQSSVGQQSVGDKVVEGFWRGVISEVAKSFFGIDVNRDALGNGLGELQQILDLDMGRVR